MVDWKAHWLALDQFALTHNYNEECCSHYVTVLGCLWAIRNYYERFLIQQIWNEGDFLRTNGHAGCIKAVNDLISQKSHGYVPMQIDLALQQVRAFPAPEYSGIVQPTMHGLVDRFFQLFRHTVERVVPLNTIKNLGKGTFLEWLAYSRSVSEHVGLIFPNLKERDFDWMEAELRLEHTKAQQLLPSTTNFKPKSEAAQQPPHPDGPEPPHFLWWDNNRYQIGDNNAVVAWRLLDFMWNRESASFSALKGVNSVWEDEVADSTIRNTVNRLKNSLPPGFPKKLATKNFTVFWKT